MSVFVIAEVGSVHDGSFGNAGMLIDLAAECGADAVKFQVHIASAETVADAPVPPYFTGEPRYEYFERTAFTEEQWSALRERCDERGVMFMASPFSDEAVDLLQRVRTAAFKIASGEVTNLPMLRRIATCGKPVFLSSGMSSWAELDAAVQALDPVRDKLTVLQCTSEYPCPPDKVGLNVMIEMRARYGVAVGLSDHTLTPYASLAAVAIGARTIEKHLTFSRHMYGSDAAHSLEPREFRDMVQGIREVETMLASRVEKDDVARLQSMKQIFEKSLVARVNIRRGTVITATAVALKKPGTGLPATRLQDVVGRRAVRDIPADTLISERDIE